MNHSAQHLKHPTIESVAKVLIINVHKRALVLTLGKHLHHPEKSFSPDLPGGIVDPGETERQAAVREAKEECGIDLGTQNVQLAFASTAFYEGENKSVTKLLYIARVKSEPQVTLSWEHSSYKWTPLDELPAVTFRPGFREGIAYLLANGLV